MQGTKRKEKETNWKAVGKGDIKEEGELNL